MATAYTAHQYVRDLLNHLQTTFAWAQENLEASVKGSKAYYDDRKACHREYQIGDKVFLFQFTTQAGISRKFLSRWAGPLEITGKLSPVAYRIRVSKPRKAPTYKWVHANQIKPFRPLSPSEGARSTPPQRDGDVTQ